MCFDAKTLFLAPAYKLAIKSGFVTSFYETQLSTNLEQTILRFGSIKIRWRHFSNRY